MWGGSVSHLVILYQKTNAAFIKQPPPIALRSTLHHCPSFSLQQAKKHSEHDSDGCGCTRTFGPIASGIKRSGSNTSRTETKKGPTPRQQKTCCGRLALVCSST